MTKPTASTGIRASRRTSPAWLLAFLLLFVFTSGPGVASQDRGKKTEADIEATLSRMAELYKAKDVAGLMTITAKEKDVTVVGILEEEPLVGYDRIRAGLERTFAGLTEIKSMEVKPYAVSESGGVAWLAADVRLIAVTKGKGVDLHGNMTAVLRKISGRWLFAQSHFSFPRQAEEKETVSLAVPPVLGRVQKKVTTMLNVIDAELAQAASELSKTGLTGPAARGVVQDLCKRTAHAVDCAAVDGKGRMVIVEPKGYAKVEGSDISAQEQVVRLRQTGQPVLSEVFLTVEGLEAVDLEHPVFSRKKESLGSVSVLMKPESLLKRAILAEARKTPFEVWVMQANGRILYNQEYKEIGKILFTDALYKPYPELLSLGRRIASEKNGQGAYRFPAPGSDKPVTKVAFWTTVSLHGAQWRIVASRVLDPAGVIAGKPSERQGGRSTLREGGKVPQVSSAGPIGGLPAPKGDNEGIRK